MSENLDKDGKVNINIANFGNGPIPTRADLL